MGRVVNKRKLEFSPESSQKQRKSRKIKSEPAKSASKQQQTKADVAAEPAYIIEDIWHVKIVKTASKNKSPNYDMEFQVKWFEWSDTQNTFEPYENVQPTEALAEYVKRKFDFLEGMITQTIDKLIVAAPKKLRDKMTNLSHEQMLKRFETFDLLYFKCSLLANINSDIYVPKNCTFIERMIKNCYIYKAMQAEKIAQLKINEQLVADIIEKDDSIARLQIENEVDFSIFNQFEYIVKVEDTTPPSSNVIKSGCSCDPVDCGSKFDNCCSQSSFDSNHQLTVKEYGMIVECSELCACNQKCMNHFVKPKLELSLFKTSNGRGWGLKTLIPIERGSFIMEYTGELIDEKTAIERESNTNLKKVPSYCFGLDFNDDSKAHFSIDAAYKGNLARFINHSCDANVQIWPAMYQYEDELKHRLYCMALKDIAAGEELTLDYSGGAGIVKDARSKIGDCKCNSEKCRGFVF